MVDVDTKEMVGAWLATATASPPVVTKTYNIDVPVGDHGAYKRIAYGNTWGRGRVFRLRSSDRDIAEVYISYAATILYFGLVNEFCCFLLPPFTFSMPCSFSLPEF